MNINDVFPSNYLKSSDLQGKKVQLTISHVEMRTMGNDEKPVLFFQGREKGLVLNKTKGMLLASSWSPETDGWHGKEVVLFATKVNFQGQMVDSIGMETIVESEQIESDLDGDIPF